MFFFCCYSIMFLTVATCSKQGSFFLRGVEINILKLIWKLLKTWLNWNLFRLLICWCLNFYKGVKLTKSEADLSRKTDQSLTRSAAKFVLASTDNFKNYKMTVRRIDRTCWVSYCASVCMFSFIVLKFCVNKFPFDLIADNFKSLNFSR